MGRPADVPTTLRFQEPDGACPVIFESMGRTAMVRGTLAPREGMVADAPEMREKPLPTMADLGMAHGDLGGMDHGGQVPSCSDLKARAPLCPDREATRGIELRLPGAMERCSWSINGKDALKLMLRSEAGYSLTHDAFETFDDQARLMPPIDDFRDAGGGVILTSPEGETRICAVAALCDLAAAGR